MGKRGKMKKGRGSGGRKWKKFDHFFVGKCNELM